MAQLWFRDTDIWCAIRLGGRVADVSASPPRMREEGSRLGAGAKAVIVRVRAGDSPGWALVVAPDCDVRVNGFAPVAGIRVLQDRDEIRTASAEPLFFSVESLAHTEEFSGGERPVFCGRCRQAIRSAEMAVRCPRCGIWYHQTENLPCWTYGPSCGFCPQSTALDAGFTWSPEA